MVQEISVDKLVFDTAQSRVKTEITDSFVESVEEHGILQNLVVRPDGNGNYIIIAGSRRYQAAREAEIHKLPCKVIDSGDEEAVIQSAVENLQREDLTDYEAIRSVTMWYDMLAEDIVGKDETVECPECEKECEGRGSYKIHVTQHCEGEHEKSSRSLYFSKRQIYNKVASQTPYKWRTVSNLVKIGKLPEEILWLVKTQDERAGEEQKNVEDKIGRSFTLSSDNSSVVSTKALKIAEFYKKAKDEHGVDSELMPNLVYKTLSSRNIKNSTSINEIEYCLDSVIELLGDWEGEVEERIRIANAANGDKVPVEENTSIEEDNAEREEGKELKEREKNQTETAEKSIDTVDESETTSWTNEEDIDDEVDETEEETTQIDFPERTVSRGDTNEEKEVSSEETKTLLGKFKGTYKFEGSEYSVNFNITSEEHEKLQDKSAERGITIQSLIEEQIKELFTDG